MKKRNVSICILLLLCMLVLLSGCRDAAPKRIDMGDAMLDFVYRAVPLASPTEGHSFSSDDKLRWDGERFTVVTRAYSAYGFDADVPPIVCTFSPDAPTLKVMDETDMPGWDVTQQGIFPLSGGECMTTAVREDTEDTEGYILALSLWDEAGNETYIVDLSREFGVDYTEVLHGNGFFSVICAVRTETEDGVRYVLLTTEGYCALNGDGTVLWSSYKGKNPRALVETDIGILYLYGDYGDACFRPIDLVTGDLGEDVILPENFPIGGFDDTFHQGDGADLYMKNSEALWGLHFTKQPEGSIVCTRERIVDFGMSALASWEIMDVCIADRNNIAVLRWDSASGAYDRELLFLTHIPRAELEAKETLVLVTLDGIDRTLARATADFNRTSGTHRLTLKDYSGYARDQRKAFFDLDVAAGYIPDMVVFYDTYVDARAYESAGLFCDLTPLLQSDAALYADLLGYTKTPYQREGGAQYLFPLSPSCDLVFGDTSVFDGPASAEDILSLYETLPDPGVLAGSQSFLFYDMLDSLFLRFTDLKQTVPVCHFDDPLFADALETVLAYRADTQITDTPLTETVSFYKGLYDFVVYRLQNGDTMIPIGIPADGAHLYVLSMDVPYFGITAPSEQKDTCLDFFRTYVSVHGKAGEGGRYLTRTQVYDAALEYADVTLFSSADGVRCIPDTSLTEPIRSAILEVNPTYFDGIVGDGYKITAADAEAFIAYLDGIDGILPFSSKLYGIFRSECMDPGERSTEDIVNAIRSRTKVYLSEVYG